MARFKLKSLRDMKISTKFTLVSLAFALPIAILLYLLIAEKNIAIDFAQKEIYGNIYLRPLRGLLEHVPQHQAIVRRYLQGDPSAKEGLLSKQAQIEGDFQALEAADKDVAEYLKTTEKLRALKAHWQELKSRVPGLSPGENNELHATLLRGIRALISYTGDVSNLILDPDLDSYYLMDATLLRLPEGGDLLAQTLTLGEGIIAQKTISADEKTQLTVLVGLLRSQADGIYNGLQVAFRNNPPKNLEPRLETPLQEAITTIKEFLEAVDKRLVKAEHLDISQAEYLELGTRALEASFKLWDRTVVELDGLLKARIDKFNKRKYLSLLSVAGVVSLTALLGIFIVRSTVKSLQTLDHAAKRIAEGDLKVWVEANTNDEVGSLGKSFNLMVENLRGLVWKVREAAEEVAHASQEVLSETEETAIGAQQQAAQIESITAAITEMAASISQLSSSAASATHTSMEARNAAEVGGEVVRTVIEKMKQMKSSVEGTQSQIRALGESGQEIGTIVGVITKITEQTDLLALNAAIEAARAGEHGKGFAVVADEVRRLAEKVATSAREISLLIEKIQTATQESVERMTQSVAEVEEGSKLVDQAGEALNQIVKVVSETAISIKQISIGTDQQEQASLEIDKNIREITTITRHTAESSNLTLEQSRRLMGLSAQLTQAIAQFKLPTPVKEEEIEGISLPWEEIKTLLMKQLKQSVEKRLKSKEETGEKEGLRRASQDVMVSLVDQVEKIVADRLKTGRAQGGNGMAGETKEGDPSPG